MCVDVGTGVFVAVGIGAPALFALSSVLVEIIIGLASKVPDISGISTELPFVFNEISISSTFIIYFAVIFIITTDLISSLVIGTVNKGEEKAGLRYFIPLCIVSLAVFFILRIVLTKFLIQAFSIV